MNRRKTFVYFIAAGALTVVFLLFAFQNQLTVHSYRVESDSVAEPVRIALLTDLHSCDYGTGQAELISTVEALQPDMVLLGGDIVDDESRMDAEKAYEAVRALAARWPTYYVTGNHEVWSGEVDDMKARLAECGAVVLGGEIVELTVNGQRLQIAGVDDPAVGEELWQSQLDAVSGAIEEGAFSILLSHRPERVEAYSCTAFDMVLAGHAHGGQWRVPGLINGLVAPDQGLFPKYAGGQYNLDGTAMIVSRGLARESTRLPRIFNPPELVIIDISAQS